MRRKLGQFFFRYRSYTPIPLLILMVLYAQPTWLSFVKGGLLVILGESLRIWSVAYAGGETRTRKVGASALVTAGPYALVRNPLYLANTLIYTGVALMANFWMPWLLLLVWVWCGVQYYFIILLEEERLLELFGEAYEAYRRTVPRILPALRPQFPMNSLSPNLRGALASERSTLLNLILVVGLLSVRMALI
ncbi:MAG: isoprenylcysteine carboxylmethyltransferase family protein [Calditrichaeota bacterium]|nr:MAG: isoprenylcysteine carboxylmethyltransferase family protein [Calditrichota bacterium]